LTVVLDEILAAETPRTLAAGYARLM
jgi:hypothetical protein